MLRQLFLSHSTVFLYRLLPRVVFRWGPLFSFRVLAGLSTIMCPNRLTIVFLISRRERTISFLRHLSRTGRRSHPPARIPVSLGTFWPFAARPAVPCTIFEFLVETADKLFVSCLRLVGGLVVSVRAIVAVVAVVETNL